MLCPELGTVDAEMHKICPWLGTLREVSCVGLRQVEWCTDNEINAAIEDGTGCCMAVAGGDRDLV